jgi:hypothetical protein
MPSYGLPVLNGGGRCSSWWWPDGRGRRGEGLEEFEASHPGAKDELLGSRSAGVAEIALDAGDERDSTTSTADFRQSTGHGK